MKDFGITQQIDDSTFEANFRSPEFRASFRTKELNRGIPVKSDNSTNMPRNSEMIRYRM